MDGLNSAKVLELGGAGLQVHLRIVEQSYRSLMNRDFPPQIHSGKFRAVSVGPGTMRFWAYNRYQPIDLPVDFMNALFGMRAGPTEEVLARARQSTGGRLDSDLALKLLEQGILVADEDAARKEPQERGPGFFA